MCSIDGTSSSLRSFWKEDLDFRASLGLTDASNAGTMQADADDGIVRARPSGPWEQQ